MRSLLLLLPLAAAACGAPDLAAADASNPVVASAHTGLAVAQYLEELRAARGLPGVSAAIVTASGDEIAVAVGLESRERGTRLEPDHLLLSGSVGKTYVAALALLLEQDGVIALEEPLARRLGDEEWFARLPNGPDLTLRDLLRHQSGLERYEMDPAFWEALFAEPDRLFTPRELVARVLDRPPAFPPGGGFRYSDTNYLLVGLALERATGRTPYDLVRERVLAPLGLEHTIPSDRRAIPGLAQGYDALFGPDGTLRPVQDDAGRLAIHPGFEGCGGGYASTPLDLARWAHLLYSGRALGADALARMLATVPARELGPGAAYGPGVIVRQTRLGELRGHDGVMLGFTSRMGFFPELGVAVAVQTNASAPGALGGPRDDVLCDLAEVAIGAERAAGAASSAPAPPVTPGERSAAAPPAASR